MTTKRYYVRVPFTGYYTVTVDTDCESDAIAQAMALQTEIDIINANDLPLLAEVDEWNTHKRIVEGNFFFGTLNEIHVDEDELEDEDKD